jgi:hypothetical protein
MAALKWTGEKFKITKQLLTNETFNEWASSEGRGVVEGALQKTRAKWFFGRRRTRHRLHREAKQALKSGEKFSIALKRDLDATPGVLRKIGVRIKQMRHKDLFSVDSTMALVVIPRAIARNEFTVFLTDALVTYPTLSRFTGLSKRVLAQVSEEAEQLFFNRVKKGTPYFHANGRAIVLEADPDFRWKMKGATGHYFCGYAIEEDKDLRQRKDLKRFKSEMKEFLFAQKTHLKQLKASEVAAIAEAFHAPRRAAVG